MADLNAMLSAVAGAAGGEATYVEDVFSTYLYTGNGSSQAITNGIALGSSNAGGSIYLAGPNTSSYVLAPSSSAFALGSGDFTIECWFQASTTSQNAGLFQISSDSSGFSATAANQLSIQLYIATVYLGSNGGFSATTSTSYAAGTWYHLALVRNGSALTVYINGVNKLSVTDSYNYTGTYLNIGGFYGGQYTFAGYISNFRIVKGTAVYTGNFTPPTSALTAISGTSILTGQGDSPLTDNSSNAFVLTTYGTVTANVFGPFTASEVGEGGLVWIKCRTIAYNNVLFDTLRGGNYRIYSNTTDAQGDGATSYGYISAFNSNGFSVAAGSSGAQHVNYNNAGFVSWTFRKQPKFFDVVTYTGNGTAGRTVSHNLGSVPGTIIVKAYSGTYSTTNWAVYHRSLGATKCMFLNNTDAVETNIAYWNNTEPTSTQFTVGNAGTTNDATCTYVAYLFAHDAGGFGEAGDQNVISCGTFTTDSGEASTTTLGWEPQWLLIKKTSAAQDWYLADNMRGLNVAGQDDYFLYPNLSDTEGTNNRIGINATGFTTSALGASSTFIYIAIRRGPMKTPEVGTEVFSVGTRAGSSSIAKTNSSVMTDLAVIKRYTSAAEYWAWTPRLTADLTLQSNSTDANLTGAMATNPWDTMTGAFCAASNGATNTSTLVDYSFRRAPGFFDVVCYTGTGSATTVTHNLGVAPELMIVKSRNNASSWYVWGGNMPMTNTMFLEQDSPSADNAPYFNDTAPTASVFSVSSFANASTWTYVAYLFATVAGVSKVGSYTGTGADGLQINCGFTNGSRFVLIKRTDSANDWHVFDSARGIVAGNDPYLKFNTTGAQVTTDDIVDSYSAGFIVNAYNGVNANGGNYIFLAIA